MVCANADLVKARLVAMGTRNLSGISEYMQGSSSNHVRHYAHCSVLIVRESPE